MLMATVFVKTLVMLIISRATNAKTLTNAKKRDTIVIRTQFAKIQTVDSGANVNRASQEMVFLADKQACYKYFVRGADGI